MTTYTLLDSPLGELLVTADGAITGLYFPDHRRGPAIDPSWRQSGAEFSELAEQLDDYFAGNRTLFDVEVRPCGTTFQRRVWRQLLTVPYGDRVTYGQLARDAGMPNAARALAAAVARNPVSIVVPCHRVVGADGTLTGYAGGIQRKRWLLELEDTSRRRPRA